MGFFKRLAEAFQDWGDEGTSMTRVVAFMFAIVLVTGIVIMAVRDHLHEMGWPFAVVCACTIFAVPVQAFFKALVEWIKSKQGRALLDKLISKVTTGELGVSPEGVAVTTTTEVGHTE